MTVTRPCLRCGEPTDRGVRPVLRDPFTNEVVEDDGGPAIPWCPPCQEETWPK